MKFAASNIGWDYQERLNAYALLRDHGFTGLEIAPALLFAEEADPLIPSRESVLRRMSELESFGLELVSMQSLLFGIQGASLFGVSAELERFQYGLVRAIKFAGRLGIGNLVFGCPRQRAIPPGLARDAVLERVLEVFLPLGDLAATHKTQLALEPNASAYGTNFMITFPETLDIVCAIDHPAVTLNFDTGALYMTDCFDRVASFAASSHPHVSHVHLSSANLAPAPESEEDARALLNGLAAIGYDRSVSIEMKAVAGDGLATLADAVARLRSAAITGLYL